MTHPLAAFLEDAGVSRATQDGGPMGTAVVLTSNPLDADEFRTAFNLVVVGWATLGTGPDPLGIQVHNRDTTAVVAVFDDARHGVCAAIGFPVDEVHNHFVVQFWPVGNRQALWVTIWAKQD